ncbi:MAG TPA: acyl-CoA dehydrogenase family protein [Mycobacteriales bacterium]|nr:acyl-CoA dehydrogenase family protein [Mycobacteriales bacterium]
MHVPDDQVLGEPGTGFAMIMQSFQWERVALALGGVTAATGDLEICTPWVRRGDRAAYAALVRRLLAQRALTYEVIERLIAGEQPLGLVSGAKWHACDLSVEAGVFRLGLARRHGTDHDVLRAERAVRDARLGPIGGGAREIMADLVARTIGLDQS